MNIRQVKAALAVRRYLSFSYAADELCYSASAISKQILSLEKELAFSLFIRKSNTAVVPTPELEMILPHLQQMESSYADICACIEKTNLSKAEQLSLSCPYGISNYYEDDFLQTFKARYPNCQINIFSERGERLVRMLASGRLDICLVHDIRNRIFDDWARRAGLDPALFEKVFLRSFGHNVAIRTGHPVINGDTLQLSQLRDLVINIFSRNENPKQSLPAMEFRKMCRTHGFEPNIRHIPDTKPELYLSQIAGSDEVLLVTSPPKLEYRGIVYLPIADTEHYVNLNLVYYRTHVSDTALRFVSCVQRRAKELFGESL